MLICRNKSIYCESDMVGVMWRQTVIVSGFMLTDTFSRVLIPVIIAARHATLPHTRS